jgi:hypothetical protein
MPSSPPAPRRRSAFETSQAMRELFGGGGGAVESPFAGLENQSQNRRRLRRRGGDNDGDEQQKEVEQKKDEKERDQVEEKEEFLGEAIGTKSEEQLGSVRRFLNFKIVISICHRFYDY